MAQVAPSDTSSVLEHTAPNPTTPSPSTTASTPPSLPLAHKSDHHRPSYSSAHNASHFASNAPFPSPPQPRSLEPKHVNHPSAEPIKGPETHAVAQPHQDLEQVDDSTLHDQESNVNEPQPSADANAVAEDEQVAAESVNDLDGVSASGEEPPNEEDMSSNLDAERFGVHPSAMGQAPHPNVMGMVAAFSEISLAQMYGQPPQIPLMQLQPVPLVPPQHASQVAHPPRHHPHHVPIPHQHHVLQQYQPCGYHMWVPQDRVGAVIGGHGAVIKSLQEKSGATIQVHNDMVRGDMKLFTIFGTLSQYEVAKQLINEIVEKPRQSHVGAHSSSDRSPYSSSGDHSSRGAEMWKTVYVPTTCVGLVIGRNGETIRNLQDRSGAEIKVTPDEEATPGAEMRSILISGTDDAISSAHQLVSEIVMDAKSRSPPYGGQRVGVGVNGQPVVHEVLAIPNEKVGLIIGKKGAAIRELQSKSGAKIQVTKDDSSIQSDGSRPVTITGMRANVDEAKAMIANKINIPLMQSPTVTSPYGNSPQQGASSMASPVGPNQAIPYLVPNVYDPAYQGGQQPFQQVYDTNDPNAQTQAAAAYFPYIGYNNYAAMAQQQRQYQTQMPMHFPHPPQAMQREQHQGMQSAHPDHTDQLSQPQFSQQHGQQLEGPQGSAGLIPRDMNGNLMMYPPHYQQVPQQVGGHQMFTSGPLNTRMFSRREHVHAAHAQAQAQMLMQAQNQAVAHAQAHSQAPLHAPGEPQVQSPAEEPRNELEIQDSTQSQQHANISAISTRTENPEPAAGD